IRGDAANDLIGFVADPNVSIQESKAFTGNIVPGRKSKGRRHITSGWFRSREHPDQEKRDLPRARQSRESRHEHKAEETKEGNV
ncbi:MAG: hypothetical protein JO061_06025, partial [Acidobacteriaceae bacterium]|nr:hypothetical protein [Acidobacteriaceae bacterium]